MLRFFDGGRKQAASEIEITYEGECFRVALKRVGAARRFTLRVRAATRDVVLTMPARASMRQAQEFTQNHAAWISHRLARLPEQLPFHPDTKIIFRGVEHVLRHRAKKRAGDGGSGPVWLEEREGRPAICASGELAHFERRIADFLRREARRELEAAVRRHAAAVGRAPTALSLRDTSSRWGSCSAKGALNFSCRLILAPPFVLDYLAAHETAHLRHHDHSENFWTLTRSLCSRTEQAEAWLKAHGAHLHRYGRRPQAGGGLSAG
jgi:predicted metal-dependent hydrolase